MLPRPVQFALLAFASSSLALACSGNVVIDDRDLRGTAVSPAQPGTTSSPPVVVPDPDPVCLVAEDSCEPEGEPCCTGMFCHDTGYGQGVCHPLQASGAYCQDASECQSGLCHQYTCVDTLPACVGLGVDCSGGSPCCEGYCVPPSYAPDSGLCAPPQEAGSSCAAGNECQSGICDLGICRTAECTGLGAECQSDATCCAGFCSGGPYAPGACTTPGPGGSTCETWLWCASMACIDSVCLP